MKHHWQTIPLRGQSTHRTCRTSINKERDGIRYDISRDVIWVCDVNSLSLTADSNNQTETSTHKWSQIDGERLRCWSLNTQPWDAQLNELVFFAEDKTVSGTGCKGHGRQLIPNGEGSRWEGRRVWCFGCQKTLEIFIFITFNLNLALFFSHQSVIPVQWETN